MERSAKVKELLAQYQGIKRPGNLLKHVYQRRDKSFTLMAAVKRQVAWNMEHKEHTSPYHQALTVLYMRCAGFENIGLFELFINEFVPGMESQKTEAGKLKVLEAMLFAQNAWDEFMTNSVRKESTSTSKDGLRESATAADAKDNAEVKTTTKQTDAYLSLRSRYLRAFIDYYFADANKSGISGKSTDKFTLTRYIRDSAENLIQTLKGMGKGPEDPLCEDVEKVFAVSQGHAERLSGGRSRPFERRSSVSPERQGHKRRSSASPERRGYKRRKGEHRRGLLDSYRPGEDSHRSRDEHQPRDE